MKQEKDKEILTIVPNEKINSHKNSKIASEKADFINGNYIEELLEETRNLSDGEVAEILYRAERFEGLSHRDVAALLNTEKPEHVDQIFRIAGKIKDHIYGERVVLFAPLYVSDYCVNNCRYCGFQHKNTFERKRLTMDEIREEVRILEGMGHKRLALEAGEDPVNCPISYVVECLETIYGMKFNNGEIRRANVNIAATTVEEYAMLRDAGIGTYILFQETYHKPTYETVHQSGPKKNYDYHTTAFDRAMEAGIDDVGGGVLFGLYDPKYEIIGLMLHNEHLEETFGVGFHTVSMPRIRAAEGAEEMEYPYAVEDELFKKLVAIVRLAIPFTGMIISTRESAEMRKELINIGISQISGGSSVEVGGYSLREKKGSQFQLADSRKAGDIITWLMEEGYVPSFCTACYRKGRTGDRFMSLAKSGNIKNVCLPNGLLTLKEYSIDYGDEVFRKLADKLIAKKLPAIQSEKVRVLVAEKLAAIEEGERDLFL